MYLRRSYKVLLMYGDPAYYTAIWAVVGEAG
jgi:hypothetical protein